MDRQLALLQRHYAALSPSSPALLPSPPFPAPSTLSLPATQQFLADRLLGHDQTLGDERGAHDWKRLFWRRVTKGIEQGFSERRAQGDAEVDDEVRTWSKCVTAHTTLHADAVFTHLRRTGSSPRHPRSHGRLALVRLFGRRAGHFDPCLLLGRSCRRAGTVAEYPD